MLDLVIPDTGPLITFALIDRLDLIDRFRCAIMVTDMVSYELLRGPETARDKPKFEKWFKNRGNQIQTIETTYGLMWKALSPEAQRQIKRLRPNAGELSIREITDALKNTIPLDDQILILFEEDAVKTLAFEPNVHLMHTFAFMVALENLGVIASADGLRGEVIAKGRTIAKDVFERRAVTGTGARPDWQSDYTVK